MTSDDGTDICLEDRRKEFVNNNMSLCEENCELVDYNYTTKKVKCSCDVKLEISEKHDPKFDKKDFFKSFIDIKNMLNFSVMKCFKYVMKIKDLMKNYGFFFISFIILLYFITLIIFSCHSFYKLKLNISKIVIELKFNELNQQNNNNDKNNENNNNNDNKNSENDGNIIIEDIISDNNDNKSNNTIINNNYDNNNNNNNNNNNKDILIMKMKNMRKSEVKERYIKIKEQIDLKKQKETKKINRSNSIEMELANKNNELSEKVPELQDFELNSLEYEEAIILDKRNYFQYYISLLKNNHPLTFPFLPFNDYNSKIIKIFLFFFSLTFDFTINTLFY